MNQKSNKLTIGEEIIIMKREILAFKCMQLTNQFLTLSQYITKQHIDLLKKTRLTLNTRFD